MTAVSNVVSKTPPLTALTRESALMIIRNQCASANQGTTVVRTARGRRARATVRTMHHVSWSRITCIASARRDLRAQDVRFRFKIVVTSLVWMEVCIIFPCPSFHISVNISRILECYYCSFCQTLFIFASCLHLQTIWALLWENRSLGFQTRFDTNRAEQPHKMARGLKLRI